MKKNVITDSEYELMKILWKRGGSSLGDIMGELKKDWSRNTVGTLLARLNEKNVIGVEKTGKTNLYYPVIGEADYSIGETKSLLSKLYMGSVGNLVAALYKTGDLTVEEIDELKKIINGENND